MDCGLSFVLFLASFIQILFCSELVLFALDFGHTTITTDCSTIMLLNYLPSDQNFYEVVDKVTFSEPDGTLGTDKMGDGCCCEHQTGALL